MNSARLELEGDVIARPAKGLEKAEKTSPKKDRSLLWVLIISILVFIFSYLHLSFDYGRIFSGTAELVGMFLDMFPPDATDWASVADSAILTFQMAWVGTLSAAIFSYIVAFWGAANISPNNKVRSLVRGFGALLRAIPVVVWAIIFVAAVGLGPMPGVMALAVHSSGMLIKVFSDSFEEVDNGLIEALQAAGASKWQVITRGIVPATFTSSLSWFLLRLDIDLRYSTILGMVGAGGIGWELVYSMRNYDFNRALFVILIIFIMLFILELFNNSFKKRIIKA